LKLFIQRKAAAGKRARQALHALTSKHALATALEQPAYPLDWHCSAHGCHALSHAGRAIPPPTLIQGSWKYAGLYVLSRLLKDLEDLRALLTWLLWGPGAEMSL